MKLGHLYRDVDGARVYYAEWSKSEGEKQILYINACMWNLEEWSYLQGRNGDADVENGCVENMGGK